HHPDLHGHGYRRAAGNLYKSPSQGAVTPPNPQGLMLRGNRARARLCARKTSQKRDQGKSMTRTLSVAFFALLAAAPALAAEPDGLILPPGFHATVVAEGVGPVRHMAVRGNDI